MRITCLAENTSTKDGIIAEHGLSLYIETAAHKILFDMGQTDAFAQNADVLGVDLAAVDLAVLSHGHYDHGGGIATFLERHPTAPVYLHRRAFSPYYNGTEKYIGLDPALQGHERLRPVAGTTPLADGITLSDASGRECLFPLDHGDLNEKTADGFVPDRFDHEHYLLLEEDGRRVLFSGCAHKGVKNIVTWFAPDVFIGGFHLSKRPLDDILAADAAYLDSFNTAYYTGHCTGTEQTAFMAKTMSRLTYLSAGDTVEI